MADSHMRLLRAVARHRQRQVEDLDGAQAAPPSGSAERRDELEQAAARSRAQAAAAQARRRQPPHD